MKENPEIKHSAFSGLISGFSFIPESWLLSRPCIFLLPKMEGGGENG
jgi:hypothetical protein